MPPKRAAAAAKAVEKKTAAAENEPKTGGANLMAMEKKAKEERPAGLTAQEQREKNIAENMKILQALGVASLVPKQKDFASLIPKAASGSKGKTPRLAPTGTQRRHVLAPTEEQLAQRRRSGRISNKPVLYSDLDLADDNDADWRPVGNGGGGRMAGYCPPGKINECTITDKSLYRFIKPDPKRDHIKGELPGVPIGFVFYSREEANYAGAHRPLVAGISGNYYGAYSITLNGGYEDDIDCGDSIAYTGAGGRNLKGTKANPKNLRTAPQSCDQHLDGSNHGLYMSMETKQPVRILRGYKLKSDYAPQKGYRYDGLYEVSDYRYQRGESGFMVYRFYLKRLPDQAPAPWSDEYEECEANLKNAFNTEDYEQQPELLKTNKEGETKENEDWSAFEREHVATEDEEQSEMDLALAQQKKTKKRSVDKKTVSFEVEKENSSVAPKAKARGRKAKEEAKEKKEEEEKRQLLLNKDAPKKRRRPRAVRVKATTKPKEEESKVSDEAETTDDAAATSTQVEDEQSAAPTKKSRVVVE